MPERYASLPKSHLWLHGVIPICVGALPLFVPPPTKVNRLIIPLSLFIILYGIGEIIRYNGWRKSPRKAS